MNSEQALYGRYATLGVLLSFVAFSGCGYGEISPTGYEYAKALYSLSNRQAAERVDAVEKQIEAAAKADELPAHESGWLLEVCEDCRAGRWKEAQAAARRMMEDQVRR